MTSKTSEQPHLLVFGPGYSASAFIKTAVANRWAVSATWRQEKAVPAIEALGATPVAYSLDALAASIPSDAVTHILVSIAPQPDGDPVLNFFKSWIASCPNLRWVGYLSSTNVYGDHGGAWVDETSETKPSLDRGKRRLDAENSWTQLGTDMDVAVHIFRLAGIYGQERNALKTVRGGKARRVIKPGQVFGRIHRDDIASALWLAANSETQNNIFNLSDDLPSPPQDVISEAARLLGVAIPPEIPIDDADLSPMGRSFYAENKRVKNQKAKDILGWQLAYPDYKQALAKILEIEKKPIRNRLK